MIIVETIQIDGNNFTRTYSDDNRYVVREGISYDQAIDPIEYPRTYTEGEKKPINDENEEQNEEQEEHTDEQYAEAGRILLGQEI